MARLYGRVSRNFAMKGSALWINRVTMTNPMQSYSPSQKFLHWTLFLIVLFMYALTFNEDIFARGDPRVDMIWRIHISVGLVMAVLVLWRVALRLGEGAPAEPAEISRIEEIAAKTSHLLLYALLIAIPALGILLTWYRGNALSFFGLFTIPAPFSPDRETARTLREFHSLCANAILVVAGLHGLAALWHHFIRRDDVLKRMLPQRFPVSKKPGW
jgi:cytochrome b561